MGKKKIPLGVSDFKTIISDNRYFVDKSLFIKDVVDGTDILLFPRPRRFGKTLNLSMLKYFFDVKEKNAKLFEGLKIASEPKIMEKQGKHPVIYLTLKDVKHRTWEGCFRMLINEISSLIISFKGELTSDQTSKINTECCQNILSRTASDTDYATSLKVLSQALYQYYQVKPVILIDEYDTPIHDGYFHDYYDKAIDFMRVFLGSALKDNNYLEKAVLTGILRVSRESMFSGLNNLKVCSICESLAADKFGFLESEVSEMLHHYEDVFSLEEIKYWYDGYNFGGSEIYNPWSILSCIDSAKLFPHWLNTSGNDLVKELCKNAESSITQDIDVLTNGGSIHKVIDDNIVFANIDRDADALWSFLLHCGYLRYDNFALVEGNFEADLSLPNYEIYCLFKRDIVKNWFKPRAKIREALTKLMNELTIGDVNVFRDEFIQYCENALSYYDVGGDEPENVYHMFVLGMLFCLKDSYHITSNRESGLGRYDVMLVPRRDAACCVRDSSDTIYGVRNRGVIFEFKKVNKDKKETFEDAIEEAKEQIVEQRYAQELQSRGCKEIVNIAVAFAGKELRVDVF